MGFIVPTNTKETKLTTLAFFDRGAAAFALCQGVKFIRVIPGQWQLYELDNSDGRAAEALQLWKAGGATVNAREFWNAFKTLKQATYNTTNDGENEDGNPIQPPR